MTKLEKILRKKSIKQSELSNRSGVAIGTVNKLFKDQLANINIDSLNKIRSVLECKFEDIWGEEEALLSKEEEKEIKDFGKNLAVINSKGSNYIKTKLTQFDKLKDHEKILDLLYDMAIKYNIKIPVMINIDNKYISSIISMIVIEFNNKLISINEKKRINREI